MSCADERLACEELPMLSLRQIVRWQLTTMSRRSFP
jgi:hypothetical protein